MEKTIEQILNENNIHNQLSIEQLLLTGWKNQFNKGQLNEICLGLEKGLNVSIYAKPIFEWEQMWEIRKGLEQGVDVLIYARPEFNYSQMQTILSGLIKGLDVTIYAKPEIDWQQMTKIASRLYAKTLQTAKSLQTEVKMRESSG